ncbi:MAG TPA: hypothetical protein DEQ43_23320, partial [Nocardioides bacterium]|nr:hypothetical protein [Nocardioides sp.]
MAPLRPRSADRAGPDQAVVRLHGGRLGRLVLPRDPRQGRDGRRPPGAARAYGDRVRRSADGRAHARAAEPHGHAGRADPIRALLLRRRGPARTRTGSDHLRRREMTYTDDRVTLPYQSPDAIRNESFQRRLRGLDAQEVYEYLDQLADQVDGCESRLNVARANNDRLVAEVQRLRAG